MFGRFNPEEKVSHSVLMGFAFLERKSASLSSQRSLAYAFLSNPSCRLRECPITRDKDLACYLLLILVLCFILQECLVRCPCKS